MKNLVKKLFYNFFNFKKSIYLINPSEDKEFLVTVLNNETILGVDTEFDWRNTYFPKLCLLQIAKD